MLAAFRRDLEAHGGCAEQIAELCLDMLPAYLKGAGEEFPRAELTFDKFHVLRLLNRAIDEVRRREQKERPELKRSRYLWLKSPTKLTERQRAWIEEQIRSSSKRTAPPAARNARAGFSAG